MINTATNTVSATITVSAQPWGVSVNHDGSKVYVTHYSSNLVSVINTVTNTVSAYIVVGNQPYGISVSPDGSKVYVVNNYPDYTVSVINSANNCLLYTSPSPRD